MTDTIHLLVERYGLVAVFLGCTAEGESSAILGGFFAHQRLFDLWPAYAAAFLGAFTGDALLFLAGRRFSGLSWVARLRHGRGFDRAFELVKSHPTSFVLLNRYAYGVRLLGGIAAGLSGIAPAKFLILNLMSAAVWAALFITAGYVFGLGAERLVGGELQKHERLLFGLGIALLIAVSVRLTARFLRRSSETAPPSR